MHPQSLVCLCEPVCVCVSLVRVVIICPASTHTPYRVGVQWPPVRAWVFFTFLHTYIQSLV